jgi:hypothetical protein
MSGGMNCKDEDKVGRSRMDSERPDLDDENRRADYESQGDSQSIK